MLPTGPGSLQELLISETCEADPRPYPLPSENPRGRAPAMRLATWLVFPFPQSLSLSQFSTGEQTQ